MVTTIITQVIGDYVVIKSQVIVIVNVCIVKISHTGTRSTTDQVISQSIIVDFTIEIIHIQVIGIVSKPVRINDVIINGVFI
jgi:hypothetical protein